MTALRQEIEKALQRGGTLTFWRQLVHCYFHCLYNNVIILRLKFISIIADRHALAEKLREQLLATQEFYTKAEEQQRQRMFDHFVLLWFDLYFNASINQDHHFK